MKPKIFEKIIYSNLYRFCRVIETFSIVLDNKWENNRLYGSTILLFLCKSLGSENKISYFDTLIKMDVHSFTDKVISNTLP